MHVAIVMDGNGRWAQAQGLPRPAGHRAGVRTVWRIVEAAPALGIRTLSLFAFSAYNWERPQAEVQNLLHLLRQYLEEGTQDCVANGVRLTVIGRRDRLPADLCGAVAASEAATRHGQTLHLRIAADYSAREAILRAARRLRGQGVITPEIFARTLGEGESAPDVDLLIRTGGEQRLSDFLLWECAFAELHFTRTPWPEFAPADLEAAVKDFHSRVRSFGRVPQPVQVACCNSLPMR
ncbi:MAG TPA: polyprenyl diphosphate synthase [Candidatus Acidoferrales bacterium]|nr:polyprenyl diphosphate synthase [Candidatus Acidoferrales bacterium]